jgi:hypothetical protein
MQGMRARPAALGDWAIGRLGDWAIGRFGNSARLLSVARA